MHPERAHLPGRTFRGVVVALLAVGLLGQDAARSNPKQIVSTRHARAATRALASVVSTDEALVELCELARRWLGCPCAPCQRAVAQARDRAEAEGRLSRASDLLAGALGARDEASARRFAAGAARWAVLRAAAFHAGVPDADADRACRALEPAAVGTRAPAPGALAPFGVASVEALFRLDGEAPSRAAVAVRDHLVRWAIKTRQGPASPGEAEGAT